MKKLAGRKMTVLAAMGLVLLLCFSACSNGQAENNNITGNQVYEQSTSNDKEDVEENDTQNQEPEETGFYAGADLHGSVVSFTDEGFKVSAAEVIKEGEGEVLVEAAPGTEAEEDLVTIIYDSDITFEIVTLDAASLKEVSREKTDKESVKKQSSVLIFGNCQDAYHWSADKVIIMRWK